MDRVICNPDIVFFENEDGAFLFDKKQKEEYSIGQKEYCLINYIKNKGICDVKDIQASGFDSDYLTVAIDVFLENGILINENKKVKTKKYKFYLNLIPYEIIKKISENVNYNFLHFFVIIFALVLIVFCSFLFLNESVVYYSDKIMQNANYSHILLLNYFVITISTIGHELYHAIFAQKYGCYVVEVGVMLKVIFSCGYVRIVGVSKCNSIQKIFIYFAGLFFNITMALIAVVLMYLFPNSLFLVRFCFIVIVTNIFLVGINLLPIFNFDGHKILKEITKCSSLNDFYKAGYSLFIKYKKIIAIYYVLQLLNIALSAHLKNKFIFIFTFILISMLIGKLVEKSEKINFYVLTSYVTLLTNIIPFAIDWKHTQETNLSVALLIYFVVMVVFILITSTCYYFFIIISF